MIPDDRGSGDAAGGSPEAEREWLRRTQKGDTEAFTEVVRLHQARLRAFAARYVTISDDVYDIVQDAFLSAFQHIDRFDTTRDFGPWIRAICRNRILKYFREQKTRSKGLDIIVTAMEQKLLGSIDVEFDDSYEQVAMLRGCLDELDGPQRALIRMRYYEDLSIKEIGRFMGKNPAAVAVQLMRIRGALRKCMERRLRQERF